MPDPPGSSRPRVSLTIARRRLLLPKEHGAYAEIGFPLLTVLLLGVPSSAALLLSIAVVCVFLLHEPALVLLGHRGARIKREAGGSAVRLAAVFARARSVSVSQDCGCPRLPLRGVLSFP